MVPLTPKFHMQRDADDLKIIHHFQSIAKDYDSWKIKSWYYHLQLKKLYREHIPRSSNVLEIGCGTGDILSSVAPQKGLGIDVSREMVKRAKLKYPNLTFLNQSVYSADLPRKFDYIILCDVIEHLTDVYAALKSIAKICANDTKVIVSSINPFWEPLLHLAEKIYFKMPEGMHNWIPLADLRTIAESAGFRVEQFGFRQLVPVYLPYISERVNNSIESLGKLQNLGFTQYLVLTKQPNNFRKKLRCSIIIPTFNEEKNITTCIK